MAPPAAPCPEARIGAGAYSSVNSTWMPHGFARGIQDRYIIYGGHVLGGVDSGQGSKAKER
eukprot:COSAG05_NODE_548_length_8749_cov_33.055838_10_plen_61_part_00